MYRERILSLALRTICFLYCAASIAGIAFVLIHGTGFRLPTTLDPSFSIGPWWAAIAITVQGIVAGAFLTALAESFWVDEDDDYGTPEHGPTRARAASTGKESTGPLIDAHKQLVA